MYINIYKYIYNIIIYCYVTVVHFKGGRLVVWTRHCLSARSLGSGLNFTSPINQYYCVLTNRLCISWFPQIRLSGAVDCKINEVEGIVF